MIKVEILTCHCKKVHIELKLENGIEELVRCNCSLCKRRGYIMAKIKLENLKIIKGTKKQAKGKSIASLSNIRDEYLVNLLKMRKKYENKIRK